MTVDNFGAASYADHTHRSSPLIWVPVTVFANSWVNFGGGLYDAAYALDASGFVVLRGVIKNGVIGSPAFTLPPGYRPGNNWRFAVVSNNLFGDVDVVPSGTVTPSIGNNAYVWLSGVRFHAVQ